MISGQDIVILSTQDWDALPTRKHHWARAFARRGNRVLFVEQQMHWLGWLYDLRRQFGRAFRWLAGPRPEEPNIWVFTPPVVLPFFQMSARVNRINNAVLAPILRWAMRRIGFERPVLWMYTPHSGDFIGRLGERLAVYECVDEFKAARGLVRPATIAALEADLIRRSHLMVVTAEALLAAKRSMAREIHLVPNGAEVEHFRQAASSDMRIPPDLAAIPKPVMGFIGWIQYWVDFDLIGHAARARPDWSFVFVGPLEPLARVDKVRGRPNVHFLGRQPYAAMPAYVAGFDVCLNPYVLDGVAEACSPIKLYEYLAAGKPIVSTDMPEARPFAGLIHLTRTPDEFLAGLDAALGEAGNAARSAERQAAAADHSWAARFAEVERILAARLNDRPMAEGRRA